jgi:hypothetical protein
LALTLTRQNRFVAVAMAIQHRTVVLRQTGRIAFLCPDYYMAGLVFSIAIHLDKKEQDGYSSPPCNPCARSSVP